MAKSHNKPKSTTKAIMFIMMAMTILVTAFACFMAWKTTDVSVLLTLIPCVFVETATCTGFYFWKRKIENLVQWKQQYGEDFIEHTIDDV